MITSVYSLFHVYGAVIWLVGWAACTLFYLGGCMFMPQNRTKYGRKAMWIGLLLAEVVTDLIWWLLYYPNGSYVNHGIGAVFGLLLWPFFLLITGIVVTTRTAVHTTGEGANK